jgi:phage baseplate assembly protein W
MIPQQEKIYSDDLEVVNMPSLTYKIDYENNRIEGTIDEIEAVEQSIDIMLETARYSEKIFPDWYGHELHSLIGQDRFYVESEVKRMIKDALSVDDRIVEMKDFTISDGEERDSIIVRFTVTTVFGDMDIEKVVAI